MPKRTPDAVDADVLYGRAAVCHHGLVELIARGKGDTEDAGKKCEREAAQAVDVERKRNTDCKQTVLCHMSQLPHRVLILVSSLDLLIIHPRSMTWSIVMKMPRATFSLNCEDSVPFWEEKEKIIAIIRIAGMKENGFNSAITIRFIKYLQ